MAQEGLGRLELLLNLEGIDTSDIIRDTTILLKNPETGKTIAKIKPKASHVNISYLPGIYDVVIDIPGYYPIPESSRVEIKRGETEKAEFKLKPVEKDYKYHIQQFFLGIKERFEL